MKLAIITAHAGASTLKQALKSWGCKDIDPFLSPWYYVDINNYSVAIGVLNGKEDGMIKSYNYGWKILPPEIDIIAYLHDDLIIKCNDWVDQVMNYFINNPRLGLLGFGGARRHGHPDIYKTPYDYRQLARFGYMSNTDDAEVHGERITGFSKVAVLDGFSLIVRREILNKSKGWPVDHIDYIGYDYWLSCSTRRLNYEIGVLGISCQHIGGQTAVLLNKASSVEEYHKSHEYIYKEFRDVLPYEAKG